MQSEPSTPLMRQYHALKQQVPHALLMFRLGDFYELFYEDAVTAARELEITLTSRSKEKGKAIPMCGVPHHASEGYIARLIQKGYRVAVCEQMEDPRFTKKLVKREIARIVTPGTATESHLLRSHENNYLAAVGRGTDARGLAHVDISTGEFRVTEMDADEIGAALETLECPRGACTASSAAVDSRMPPHTKLEELDLRSRLLRTRAARAFQATELWMAADWRASRSPSARPARSCTTCATRRGARSITSTGRSYYDRSGAMVLDAVSIRNLELIEPLFAGESRESTLVSVLDQTCTGMGGRLLRSRLLRPSLGTRGDRSAAGRGRRNSSRRQSSGRNCGRRSASILDLERCWRR